MTTLNVTMTKEPGSTLDYDLDFAERWLVDGDEIASAAHAIEGGTASIVQADVSVGAVKLWITGGAPNEQSVVTVTATTAQNRIKEVSFRLRIRGN